MIARGSAAAALAGAIALACAASPEAPPRETAAPGPPAPPAAFVRPDPAGLAPAPARVVLVGVAGLPARAYRDAPGAPAWMPVLAGLARDGAAADAVAPVSPASPVVASATLVTGRTPAAHGVAADHALGESGTDAARQRDAAAFATPPLWALARRAGMAAAVLGWPASVAADAPWVFPDLVPARFGEAWPAILEGRATPELVAAARGLGVDAPETGFPGPARDALLAGLACHLLTRPDPPRLVLLRLSQTEVPLLRAGPDSEDTAEAFARVDAELARVLGCLADAGRLSTTAVVVAGDVPVAPVHGRIHPNRALADAGLLVPSPRSRTGIQRWDAVVRSNGTSAFVYARDSEAAVLARTALRAAAERTLAFRVVSAEEMLALAADREAWFGLEALPGFVFGEGLGGDGLVQPAGARGAWGGLARGASPDLGFVAWGAGVRPAVRVPELRQTDVAPTVAALLGLALPEAEGRPLVGALRGPTAPVAAPRLEPVAPGPR